jgi:hydrogenase 3 maturation protease
MVIPSLDKKEKRDIEGELRAWFRGAGRVVVVGVGNPIRMDDFVGVKIVRDLRGKVDSDRVMLIEAETVPENYMQQIADYKPTHILIIDAAIQGLKPGGSRLINPEQLTNYPAFSTHMLPLRMFCEYLEATTVKMGLLIIEPEKTDFGEGITSKVETASRTIHEMLLKLLSLNFSSFWVKQAKTISSRYDLRS